jgi:hypothetical protein
MPGVPRIPPFPVSLSRAAPAPPFREPLAPGSRSGRQWGGGRGGRWGAKRKTSRCAVSDGAGEALGVDTMGKKIPYPFPGRGRNKGQSWGHSASRSRSERVETVDLGGEKGKRFLTRSLFVPKGRFEGDDSVFPGPRVKGMRDANPHGEGRIGIVSFVGGRCRVGHFAHCQT